MSKNILICVLILILMIYIGFLVYISNEKPKENINTSAQENCNHECITVSKYNWWLHSYKVYTKCSKCGKVIE